MGVTRVRMEKWPRHLDRGQTSSCGEPPDMRSTMMSPAMSSCKGEVREHWTRSLRGNWSWGRRRGHRALRVERGKLFGGVDRR